MNSGAAWSSEPLSLRTTAPPQEFFQESRRAAGEDSVAIVLGSLRVEILGLDGERATALRERYAPFSAPTDPAGEALRIRVGLEDRDYFITPPRSAESNPVVLAHDQDRVRYLGYTVAGWFDCTTGRGELLLARGTYEPDLRAIENYVRVAVAWQAVWRGGALVHAASAAWRDRGYLFYGESGAGKSTLAAANRRARITSDDLSLVLPGAGGGLDLVGSPFRGTYEGGETVVGSFPLAAGFRIVQAPRAEVQPVPRVRAFAELVANLPFVAEAFDQHPELFERVERSFAGIPLAHLLFRKDESYWDAIESAGL